MYQKYYTEALVLGSREYGEADRVFALYTKDFGLVWARASAVRSETSRMRYALQHYARAKAALVRGKRGWRIGGAVAADHLSLSAATVFARIARLVPRRVRLVLVPRHPERAPSVVETLAARGAPVVRWSQIGEARPRLAVDAVVLVDTIGHLEAFYGACDVAFVGGSLVPHGGQNMLEPAALGRAVLFGPNTWNFRADVELLLAAEAVLQIGGRNELDAALLRLLGDPALRAALGERAVALIRENQGATARTLELIAPLLDRSLGSIDAHGR